MIIKSNIMGALSNLCEAQSHLLKLEYTMRNSPGLTVHPMGTLERARRRTQDALIQIELAQARARDILNTK